MVAHCVDIPPFFRPLRGAGPFFHDLVENLCILWITSGFLSTASLPVDLTSLARAMWKGFFGFFHSCPHTGATPVDNFVGFFTNEPCSPAGK